MEAVVLAASAAAAAAKEAALAASVATKDAALAAATAKEAVLAASAAAEAAKKAALAASVAAKEAALAATTAKAATVAASAAALHAKEAAVVAATAGEAAATAAAAAQEAVHAAKERKCHMGSGNINDGGSIGILPDAILGSIISLLPTKEGVRTQAISRRWHTLWSSAPLNLVVDYKLMSKECSTVDLIAKILAEHHGPASRFLLCDYISASYEKIEQWLSSRALDNLHELELNYTLCYGYYLENQLYPLPSSVYRFASTLRVAKFSACHLPDLIVQLSLKFPCLKQLTLKSITISEDALQSIISGSPVLESLELNKIFGTGRICITSQTLRSIGLYVRWRKESVLLQELVVEDAPCLERLLPLDPQFGPATIRVISAPKLKILGVLSQDIPELHFGTTFFQKMIAVSLTTKMQTVRVLVLNSAGPNLDIVVNFLKCFPCLERLYVVIQSGMGMDNIWKYDPVDPIECLELHLKEVVVKNYDGTKPSIDFVKFFVMNAKVLKDMKIKLPCHRQQNWFPKQHRLLRIENRVSRDARIELTCGTMDNLTHNSHTHDLSIDDPFDMPSGGCYNCS